MYGDVGRTKVDNLINRLGKVLKIISGKACNKVNVNISEADLLRQLKGAEKVVYSMVTANLAKNIVV